MQGKGDHQKNKVNHQKKVNVNNSGQIVNNFSKNAKQLKKNKQDKLRQRKNRLSREYRDTETRRKDIDKVRDQAKLHKQTKRLSREYRDTETRRKETKRLSREYRDTETRRKHIDKVRDQAKLHKQTKRLSREYKDTETRRKETKRLSREYRDTETRRKHIDKVRDQAKLHKQTKRISREYRDTETRRKHIDKVRDQAKLHKQTKRISREYRDTETRRKDIDEVRDQAKLHKQTKRLSREYRDTETRRKETKRLSREYRDTETRRKDIDKVRDQAKLHKQTKRISREYRDTETRRKHIDKVRDQAKLHKQTKRLSREYRETETRRKHIDKVRSQAALHKARLRKCLSFRKLENHRERQAYIKHMKIRNLKKKRNLLRKQNKRKSLSDIKLTIKNFQDACKQMPIYTCAVCYRYLFRKQVQVLNNSKYMDEELVQSCLQNTSPNISEPKYICKTCHGSLKSGKIPSQAAANSMYLPALPDALRNLNQLEKHLISPIIPFMKIMTLPKGLQKGIHGPVVCVPSNVSKVQKVLPRPLNDDTLLKVKLKRKMEYRGHHLYQQVSMSKIRTALEWLVQNNPHFKGIQLDDEAMVNVSDPDEASILRNELDSEQDIQFDDGMTVHTGDRGGMTVDSGDPGAMKAGSGDPAGMMVGSGDPSSMTVDSGDPGGMTVHTGDPGGMTVDSSDLDEASIRMKLDSEQVVSGVTSSTKTHTDKPSRETRNDSPDTNTAHSLVDVEMGLNESQNFQTDTDHVAEDESNMISEAETSQSARNGMDETGGTELHETSCPMVSCLQPENIGQILSEDVTEKLYSVAPAEGNKPCSVFEMESKAFPYLIPNGKNGHDEERNSKIGLNRYFNLRLFSADTRFASDPQYIFYSQYASELHYVKNSISIALRKSSKITPDNANVTAAMLKDVEERKKIIRSDLGYRFLKTVRGTPPYWEKTLLDLFGMLRQLGTPTWFCSFSAADRRWPEICEAICKQQGREVPDNMDWTTHCNIINSNPVTACRMFEHRVINFIHAVILSPANPIGHVTDFFYRTEFQSRGWPHIHCLFWCENAPKFAKKQDNTSMSSFIDQYVTAEMPDKESVVYDIVNSVQMHSKNHSKSCKKGSKICRFNFPRPPSMRTFIAEKADPPDDVPIEVYQKQAKDVLTSVWNEIQKDNSDDITALSEIFAKVGISQEAYEKAHCALTKRNVVIYKRSVEGCWINPYNIHLLEAWDGNMDIQPVLDPESCIMYIVGYITKSEREQGDLLRKAQREAAEGNTEPLKLLQKLGNIYLTHREISIMEAIYRVTGMKLKQSSREVIFVPTDPNSVRISKPLHLINDEMDDEDLWMTNVVDRYLARPEEFECMCLAEFASQYKVTYTKNSKSKAPLEDTGEGDSETKQPKHVYQLQNGMGSITKRQKRAVVRYPHFNKAKDSERYYANLLKMYYPHRTTTIDPDLSYEELFLSEKQIILENMAQFERLTEDLDEAWEQLKQQGPQEDAWAEIAPNSETERVDQEFEMLQHLEDFEEIDYDDTNDTIPDLDVQSKRKINFVEESHNSSGVHIETINKTKVSEDVRTLNAEQSQLFYFIRDWALKKSRGESVDAFHIFLTGGAGTGKSHLVRCIKAELERTLVPNSGNPDSPVVLQVAYVGTAAFNISGQTIHSAFNVNKKKNNFLGEDSANTLRTKYQDLQLLVIDEVSMVNTDLLKTIHCRLQQIMQCRSPDVYFGNISVLAVGDFYQIPPVFGTPLCNQRNSLTDIWSIFHKWELHQVVRQQGDMTFVHMLNRLRVRQRSEPLDPNDLSLLKTRLISPSDPDYPKRALHIFATRERRDNHNQVMLEEISDTETRTVIQAADISLNRKTHQSFRRKQPLKTDSCLQEEVTLCPGARTMLTVNLDVEDGLTNGAIGTVSAIITGTGNLRQPSVCVHFDNESVGRKSRQSLPPPPHVDQNSTVIRPHTDVIQNKPLQVTRHQLPLTLAWGITIHKVQGMTTAQCVVSLKNIFKSGMGYVALSRVTSLSGLFLIEDDFTETAIYCNPKVAGFLTDMKSVTSLESWRELELPDIRNITESMMIISHNTEGLLPHLHDINRNGLIHQSSVICLQETWLTPTQDVSSILPGYNSVLVHRQNQYTRSAVPDSLKYTGRGGVGIFIKHGIQYTQVDTSDLPIECVAVLLHMPHIMLVCVYRPPGLDLRHFCSNLNEFLEAMNTKEIILVGDFNVDCIKSSIPALNDNYLQLISKPTTRKGTALDHVYIRNIDYICSGVASCHYSYHEMTYVIIKQEQC